MACLWSSKIQEAGQWWFTYFSSQYYCHSSANQLDRVQNKILVFLFLAWNQGTLEDETCWWLLQPNPIREIEPDEGLQRFQWAWNQDINASHLVFVLLCLALELFNGINFLGMLRKDKVAVLIKKPIQLCPYDYVQKNLPPPLHLYRSGLILIRQHPSSLNRFILLKESRARTLCLAATAPATWLTREASFSSNSSWFLPRLNRREWANLQSI